MFIFNLTTLILILLTGHVLYNKNGIVYGKAQLRWAKEYGTVFKFHEVLNRPAIFVADAKLIHEIAISNVYDYTKPRFGDLIKIFGDGLVSAEGENHKRQRKMMGPAFAHNIVKVIMLHW